MKFKTKALLLTSLILFVTLFSAHPRLSSEETDSKAVSQSAAQSASSGRTVDFKWYSFFDVPIKADVWDRRWVRYGTDHLISSTYPIVYLWQPELGWNYYYTSARLKVTAKELPEIWINSPKVLPFNLMGELEPTVTDGTAQIKNWYLDYVDEARRAAIGFPVGWWDGYVTELKGTVVMDRSATKKILGITEAQYNNIVSWWTANEKDVEAAWSAWLYNEDARLDIRPFFDYPYTDWPTKYTDYLELSYNAALDQVTLTLDLVTNGMECLLARWFQETFMPGYEWWWDDFKFNATIGPSLTNIDMDTAVQWAMYMWSYNDTAFAEPVWVWEAVRGDVPDLAADPPVGYGVPTSPAYPYYAKTYYVVAPGNEWYDRYGDYDYTPSAWNLKQGETLTFDWSNVYQKGPIWVYKQNNWVPPQKPNDTITRVYGILKLSAETSEPYADWGEFPDRISYSPIAKTITFNGPVNMTDLSFNNIQSEWARLTDPQHPNGLLPWGEPFLEFKVVQHDVTVSSVTPSLTEAYIGQTVDVNVDVVNLGTTAETFSVTAFYDSTQIGTPQTVTSLGSGQSRTLTFSWNTAGVGKGNYKIKAVASTVPGETYTADNTLVDGTVSIGALHDVAVTSVSASPLSVVVGQNITITVNVKNEGMSTETDFNVTAYANTTTVGTQTVTSLAKGDTESLTFKWNTTGMTAGSYTIKATAELPGDAYPDDNTYVDGKVAVKLPTPHDIVVLSVVASPTSVIIGEDVTITSVVKNDGTSPETFNVTAVFDSTEIETKLVTNLQPGNNSTVIFIWNTAGAPLGNHTIKVTAGPVPGETYIDDNTYLDGEVMVQAIIHDVEVVGVSAAPSTVNVGENITIVATVKNKGMAAETFNVTAYYDNNSIETKTVTNLPPNGTRTPIFTWVTSGVAAGEYTIKATAELSGDANPGDNTRVYGTVTLKTPPVHDIEVTSVTASPTTVNIGDNVTITVIVKNNGTIAETTSITVYRNLTIITTRTDVNLTSTEEKTLTIIWNTAGVDEGKYTIKATAATVSGETDTTDNTYVDGTITVKQPPAPAGPVSLPIEILGIIIVVVVIAAVSTVYIYRQRKKSSTRPAS